MAGPQPEAMSSDTMLGIALRANKIASEIAEANGWGKDTRVAALAVAIAQDLHMEAIAAAIAQDNAAAPTPEKRSPQRKELETSRFEWCKKLEATVEFIGHEERFPGPKDKHGDFKIGMWWLTNYKNDKAKAYIDFRRKTAPNPDLAFTHLQEGLNALTEYARDPKRLTKIEKFQLSFYLINISAHICTEWKYSTIGPERGKHFEQGIDRAIGAVINHNVNPDCHFLCMAGGFFADERWGGGTHEDFDRAGWIREQSDFLKSDVLKNLKRSREKKKELMTTILGHDEFD